jgi:DNA-directed RNA polymerase subunit M/transcription elongation factor TFIIS
MGTDSTEAESLMIEEERTLDCTNCGTTVTVEFGDYVGGPLAYDSFAKCKNCGKEYTDHAEISRLVTSRRKQVKIRGLG